VAAWSRLEIGLSSLTQQHNLPHSALNRGWYCSSLTTTLNGMDGRSAAHPKVLVRAFLEDFLYDRQGGKGIRPTGVEGQVRDNLRCLLLR